VAVGAPVAGAAVQASSRPVRRLLAERGWTHRRYAAPAQGGRVTVADVIVHGHYQGCSGTAGGRALGAATHVDGRNISAGTVPRVVVA